MRRERRPDVDVERIAERAAEIVLARLARGLAPAPTHYSTRAGHAPAGWTDEGWRAVAAQVPGTYRPTGADGKPARWLITPRDAFDAWIASRSTAPTTAPTAANDAPWTPDDVLAELGLRRPAGGSR